MKTPLELMRMCPLPQGATNSVAHMQNAMNKITWKIVLEKTIPFLNNIHIKVAKRRLESQNWMRMDAKDF